MGTCANIKKRNVNTNAKIVNDAQIEKCQIYAIGRKQSKKCQTFQTLTPNYHLKNKNITNIYCTLNQNIYSSGNKQFWFDRSKRIEKILYFEQNNIEITKVITQSFSDKIYWISKNNMVYHQQNNKFQQIPDIFDVIDIQQQTKVIHELHRNKVRFQSLQTFCYCLCNHSMSIQLIINNWHFDPIPNEILRQIINYHGNANEIYIQTNSQQHEWKKVAFFRDKQITKIVSGRSYTLFLDSVGVVWCSYNSQRITKIDLSNQNSWPYNPIKMVDVLRSKDDVYECGLALDANHNIYQFKKSKKAVLVLNMKRYKIIQIQCGSNHFYAKTEDNKHFLWGGNKFNQCITNESDNINSPYCINQAVYEQTNGGIIKSVFLGDYSTEIILCNKELGEDIFMDPICGADIYVSAVEMDAVVKLIVTWNKHSVPILCLSDKVIADYHHRIERVVHNRFGLGSFGKFKIRGICRETMMIDMALGNTLYKLEEQIKIKVKYNENNVEVMDYYQLQTLNDIFVKYAKIVPSDVHIYLNGNSFIYDINDINKSLDEIGVSHGSLIFVKNVVLENERCCQFVKGLDGKTEIYDVNLNWKVFDYKYLIYKKHGIPIDLIRLICCGKQLADGYILSDYGIQNESTSHLVLRNRGS